MGKLRNKLWRALSRASGARINFRSSHALYDTTATPYPLVLSTSTAHKVLLLPLLENVRGEGKFETTKVP